MGHNSASPKTLSKLPARPMEPRFDRPFGTAHHACDFGATEILLIEQYETETVIVPQFANRRFQLIRQIPRIAGAGRDRLVQMERAAERISGPLLEDRAATIGGNRQNPRFQRSRRVPPFEAPKSPKENVLGDVFRVFTLSQHSKAEGEDEGLEPLDQLARSDLLAAEIPSDQGCIVAHTTPCASISRYQGLLPPVSAFGAGR
jgi:hypothetical protein